MIPTWTLTDDPPGKHPCTCPRGLNEISPGVLPGTTLGVLPKIPSKISSDISTSTPWRRPTKICSGSPPKIPCGWPPLIPTGNTPKISLAIFSRIISAILLTTLSEFFQRFLHELLHQDFLHKFLQIFPGLWLVYTTFVSTVQKDEKSNSQVMIPLKNNLSYSQMASKETSVTTVTLLVQIKWSCHFFTQKKKCFVLLLREE